MVQGQNDEYVGFEQNRKDEAFHVSKKKIWRGNQWEEHKFYRLYGDSKLEDWCKEKFGQPQYQGSWFRISRYIVLNEKTYMFWKLCE
jgi:hypothetical protein